MKKNVKVVGAIIENEKNEILCALRSFDMSLSNYWEFPGGKIENGETPQEAIEREILEELGCCIEAFGEVFDVYTHEYEKVIVELITIKCEIIEGDVNSKEHAKVIWLPKEHLRSLKWAPADISAVEKLIK
jgi:8-oxo-dGTP diphosphatase